MRRTAVRAIVLATIGALLLTAGGCGGGDEESAADTQAAAATAPATTESAATTATETEATETDVTEASGTPDFASAESCTELVGLGVKVSQAFGGASVANSEGPQKLLDEFADKAPEEIRSDFAIIADTVAKITDALEDVHVAAGESPNPEAVERLQKVVTELDHDALTKANANITAWVEKNC